MRIDELVRTGHDAQIREDYQRLARTGILAARDGIRWNLVDRKGRLDFSSAFPYLDSAEEMGITVIWDLFHYGYPDDLNPFESGFIERFCAYCRGFAKLLVERGHGERAGVRFYTPI